MKGLEQFTGMIRSILTPISNTDHSYAALDGAIALSTSENAPRMEVRALFVRDLEEYVEEAGFSRKAASVVKTQVKEADRLAAEAFKRMEDEEAAVRVKFEEYAKKCSCPAFFEVEKGSVADIILEREKSADLIVMGRSRIGDQNWRKGLGKKFRQVLRRSHHSVILTGREGRLRPGGHVLTAYGGGRSSSAALRDTAIMATLLDCRVTVLIPEDDEDTAALYIKTVDDYLRPYDIRPETVWNRWNPYRALLESYERLHPSMVIVGAHSWKSWTRILLGSMSERIAKRLGIPVLISK